MSTEKPVDLNLLELPSLRIPDSLTYSMEQNSNASRRAWQVASPTPPSANFFLQSFELFHHESLPTYRYTHQSNRVGNVVCPFQATRRNLTVSFLHNLQILGKMCFGRYKPPEPMETAQ